MSRAVRVNATIDEELLRRVDAYARSHYEDRSTAVRQLLDFALRELHKRGCADGVRGGAGHAAGAGRALGLTSGLRTTCSGPKESTSPEATGGDRHVLEDVLAEIDPPAQP